MHGKIKNLSNVLDLALLETKSNILKRSKKIEAILFI